MCMVTRWSDNSKCIIDHGLRAHSGDCFNGATRRYEGSLGSEFVHISVFNVVILLAFKLLSIFSDMFDVQCFVAKEQILVLCLL